MDSDHFRVILKAFLCSTEPKVVKKFFVSRFTEKKDGDEWLGTVKDKINIYSRPALARPKCVLRRPKQTRGKMEITLPPDGVRRQTGYVGTSPDRALRDSGTAGRHF